MNATFASVPTIFSKMLARAIDSPSPHTLVVQIKQATVRVVFPLDRPVGVAVVQLPELLTGVEARRIKRLVTVEIVHGVLDQPVVVTVELPPWQWHHSPEPEVDVQLAGLQRVERPAGRGPQRAHPHRRHADL